MLIIWIDQLGVYLESRVNILDRPRGPSSTIFSRRMAMVTLINTWAIQPVLFFRRIGRAPPCCPIGVNHGSGKTPEKFTRKKRVSINMTCANFWTVLHFRHFILHLEPSDRANTFRTWRLKPAEKCQGPISRIYANNSYIPSISHRSILSPWNGRFYTPIGFIPLLNPYLNWFGGCGSQHGNDM